MAAVTTPKTTRTTSTTGPDVARRGQRRGWLSLALIPVSLIVSMVIGEFLLSVQGYEVGAEELPPLGPALLAGIPAILVGITPAVAAVWFGLQARQHGNPRGGVPALIGGVIAVGYIAVNLAAPILGG